MRRIFAFPLSISLAFGACALPAMAAPTGFYEAQRVFDTELTVDQRILTQILLLAAGYGNAVPTEHLNLRTMQALQSFQADNGFNPNGRLDKPQLDRLIAQGGTKLAGWGFEKVFYPGRSLAIWAPLGVGLDVKQNATGLHFKDRQGRLWLDMVAVGNKDVGSVYRGVLAEKARQDAKVHYQVIKDGWFVVSATTPDGNDHYYRYHQDGDGVTGFALEWNNAAGNINAERIAVIMSGSLWSAMTGAPFIDPPRGMGEAQAAPPVVPATVPVAPAPTPEPKTGFSTGTGFFVSEAGHFVTNAHVVKDCSDVAVKTDDGAVGKAEIVATDVTNDLALLRLAKTPKRVVALRVGVRLGEGVEAFGFPHTDILATAGNFTLGNVSALSGLGDDSRYLQISAPVQAGNSGGPLLDTSGNLVGVVSMKLNAMKMAVDSNDLPQNVNFAIKSGTLANFLDANRVTYKVGAPAAVPLQPADIADAARAVSGFVVCK